MRDDRELKIVLMALLALMWLAGFVVGWKVAHWFIFEYLP